MIKKGFTLAELTIALGVVGVLAIILLPILLNTKPNEEMLKFKKAYYLTSRIVSELVNDEDLYEDGTLKSTDSTRFCTLFYGKLNTAATPGTICEGSVELDDGGDLMTTDGIIWQLPKSTFSLDDSAEDISIDVNGTKSPNCYYDAETCPNPDRFSILVSPDGMVTVDGDMEREYLNRSSISENGTRTSIQTKNLPIKKWNPNGFEPFDE